MHPGQKLKPGARVVFEGVRTLHGEMLERRFFGRRVVRLWTEDGSPWTRRSTRSATCRCRRTSSATTAPDDRDRYQTVFAHARGSVAAPTAGLHFTPALLDALRARGVEIAEITLHVGYGTFQPVRVDRVEDHRLDAERYEIDGAAAAGDQRARSPKAAASSRSARRRRGRSKRSARAHGGRDRRRARRDRSVHLSRASSSASISGLLTNFHLPQSSLLMLVAAFAGRERVLQRVRCRDRARLPVLQLRRRDADPVTGESRIRTRDSGNSGSQFVLECQYAFTTKNSICPASGPIR